MNIHASLFLVGVTAAVGVLGGCSGKTQNRTGSEIGDAGSGVKPDASVTRGDEGAEAGSGDASPALCGAPCKADADCGSCGGPQTCLTGLCRPVCSDEKVYTGNAYVNAPDPILSRPVDVPETFAGVTEIDGSLTIGDVPNLAAFTCLKRVTGDLSIGFYVYCGRFVACSEPSGVVDGTGLERLETVRGTLTINDNLTLTKLDSLKKLGSLGGLSVTGNPLLARLSFPSLSRIDGQVDIERDPALSDLGLDGVTSVGSLKLGNLDSLATLTALGALTEVGPLVITAIPRLESIAPLAGITSLGGGVELTELPALTSLVGFPPVATVPGNLLIGADETLADLGGLAALTEVDGDMNIANAGLVSSLSPLSHLQKITGGLTLSSLSLRSLVGLEALTSLGSLSIDTTPITTLAPLASVKGHLSWVTLNTTAVTDLTGLSGVTGIDGSLVLYENGSLATLSGLENITFTQGLDIRNNDALSSIGALSKLTKVDGDIVLGDAPNLQSLTGLEALTEVTGALDLVNMPKVASLAPFGGLKGAVGRLYVMGVGVADLHGLEGVTSVTYELGIGTSSYDSGMTGTPVLASLAALRNLTSVGSLAIRGNEALTSLAGLEGITHLTALPITDNPVLSSLDGLKNVTAVDADITISNDPALRQCEVDAFGAKVGFSCARPCRLCSECSGLSGAACP